MAIKQCEATGCLKFQKARGLCDQHYNAARNIARTPSSGEAEASKPNDFERGVEAMRARAASEVCPKCAVGEGYYAAMGGVIRHTYGPCLAWTIHNSHVADPLAARTQEAEQHEA